MVGYVYFALLNIQLVFLHNLNIKYIMQHTAHPTSRYELRCILEEELERQGQDADLNFIDTSLITNMYDLFVDLFDTNYNTLSIRNIKIDKWDVSNVEDMCSMFWGLSDFTADLSGWDTSNVTNMTCMFQYAENFDSDLSSWDVSKVTDMDTMFAYCESFSSDLSSWNTSSLVYADKVFWKATKMEDKKEYHPNFDNINKTTRSFVEILY